MPKRIPPDREDLARELTTAAGVSPEIETGARETFARARAGTNSPKAASTSAAYREQFSLTRADQRKFGVMRPERIPASGHSTVRDGSLAEGPPVAIHGW